MRQKASFGFVTSKSVSLFPPLFAFLLQTGDRRKLAIRISRSRNARVNVLEQLFALSVRKLERIDLQEVVLEISNVSPNDTVSVFKKKVLVDQVFDADAFAFRERVESTHSVDHALLQTENVHRHSHLSATSNAKCVVFRFLVGFS